MQLPGGNTSILRPGNGKFINIGQGHGGLQRTIKVEPSSCTRRILSTAVPLSHPSASIPSTESLLVA